MRSWAEYETHLLLGGSWLPITEGVVFARASVADCAKHLTSQRKENGKPWVTAHDVHGDDLPSLLSKLLPLQAGQTTRHLLMRTANPAWTAVFGANWRGLETWEFMAWPAQAGIDSVGVTDSPHTITSDGKGFYGCRGFRVARATAGKEPIWSSVRVRAANLRTWQIDGPSEFDVGLEWDPNAKRVQDRFTHEHLVAMAAKFALRPFDEDFYSPDGRGVIIQLHVDNDVAPKETTLAAARGEEPPGWKFGE